MEKHIEKKLRLRVEALGGRAFKFVSPNVRGVPDRIILLPGGRFAFAEIKDLGEDLSPLQKKRKRELEAMGFRVYVVDSDEDIQEVIDDLQAAPISGVF